MAYLRGMTTIDDMTGKRVLVTGANAGIGNAIARSLADAGADLLVHGRDASRVDAAVDALRGSARGGVRGVVADFTSLASVARLADEVAAGGPLDVLVNNAGLIRDRLVLNADGYEEVFQVNHLAAFLLTLRLMPALRAAPSARVVTVASGAHGMAKDLEVDRLTRPEPYLPMQVYARSKACNILFTTELARRVAGSGVKAFSYHPGIVASRFAHDGDVRGRLRLFIWLFRPFSKTPEKGADTGAWLASAAPVPEPDGGYFIDRRAAAPRPYARDEGTARQLWELSERLVAPHLQTEERHARAG